MKVQIVIGLVTGFSVCYAQGSAADYARSQAFPQWASGKITNLNLKPQWLDNSKCWYVVEPKVGKRSYVLFDAKTGQTRDLFDHAALAAALGVSLGRTIPSDEIPIDQLSLGADGTLTFQAGGNSFSWDPKSKKLKKIDALKSNAGMHPGDAPSASPGANVAATITFINLLNEPITIDWRTYEGELRNYHTLKPGERVTQNTFEGHVWMARKMDGTPISAFVADAGSNLAEISGTPKRRPRAPRQNPNISPNQKWEVRSQSGRIALRDTSGSTWNDITFEAPKGTQIVGPTLWSPDSNWVVLFQRTPGDRRQIPIVQSSPPNQLQPILKMIDYAKPGDKVDQDIPLFLNIKTKSVTTAKSEQIQNQWSMDRFEWSPDSKQFQFLYNQRGHQALTVFSADPNSGDLRPIIQETSNTFIDYSSKTFLENVWETNESIWMSERSGYNHLYLFDHKSGKIKNAITSGNFVVREVKSVDTEARQIVFTAGGFNPVEDPYHLHTFRVNFDGSHLTRLTEGDGTHEIYYSPDKSYYLDKYSRVDLPPVYEIRRFNDGKKIAEIARSSDQQLLSEGWRRPVRFAAKGRDGKTDIYGYYVLPTTFDPSKKYPVIEDIYAGPHGQHVRKAFATYDGLNSMAELGFIVVKIDGMGTNWRSRAFHDVCWKNLADAGFPDRIQWIKQLAEKVPQMDLNRVGIYGVSAGGQNALHALLTHGEFYKVAMADCGCYDNRVDKIWWNEQWMGYPIGPHYEKQACATLAPNLTGKLLLMVGEVDTNVDPASTMQVVNALIKANKDFELLVAPNVGHGVIGTPYGKRRMQDFFVRNLLGVEPRW